MSKTIKITIGVVISIIVVSIVILTNNTTQYIAPEDQGSSQSSSESSKSKSEKELKEKGTITVEDTVHDSKLAAAVMGLFGGWKLEDKGWEAVGNSLAARDEIDIFYSADSKGKTKYQFVRIGEKESDKTPWYRLAGDELRTVIYFSGDNKELGKFKLADMVDYVNDHYSNDELFTIKVGIYVQPSGEPNKAKLKGREITAQNTPKEVQQRSVQNSSSSKNKKSSTTAKKSVDLNADYNKNQNLWAREIMTYVENNLNEISEYAGSRDAQFESIVNTKLGKRDEINQSLDLNEEPRWYMAHLQSKALVLPKNAGGYKLEMIGDELILSIQYFGPAKNIATIPLDVVEGYLSGFSGDLVTVKILTHQN